MFFPIHRPFRSRYVCIDMAPLLARPGSTSERWHVLSSPSDDISGNNAVAGGNTEAAAQSGTATKSSAGTILLSLGFTPTGGTPRIRPLSAVGPASTSRNSRSTTPGGFISGIVSVSPSANGGGGSGWGDSGRRTPRTSLTPAIPEGFSLTDEIATTASALLSSTPSENRAAGGEEPRPRQGMVDSRTRAKPGGVNGDKLFDRAGTGNTQSKSFFGGIGGQEEGISSSLDSKRVEATGEGGRGLELGDGDGDTQQAEGKVHLFRVRNYSAPVWCEVCQRLLMGVSRTVSAFLGKGCGGGDRRGGGEVCVCPLASSRLNGQLPRLSSLPRSLLCRSSCMSVQRELKVRSIMKRCAIRNGDVRGQAARNAMLHLKPSDWFSIASRKRF